MAGGILVAKKTASLVWNGSHIVIKQGVTTARVGHPLLDCYGEMFEPIRVDFDLDEAPDLATPIASAGEETGQAKSRRARTRMGDT
jgi:hypothetical protein